MDIAQSGFFPVSNTDIWFVEPSTTGDRLSATRSVSVSLLDDFPQRIRKHHDNYLPIINCFYKFID